jgi:hypothetical protein
VPNVKTVFRKCTVPSSENSELIAEALRSKRRTHLAPTWIAEIQTTSVIDKPRAYTRYSLYLLIYLLTHGAEPLLRSCQLCSHSRISQHFMESEGSIPCSEEPSTGPYPEAYESNPHQPIPSL